MEDEIMRTPAQGVLHRLVAEALALLVLAVACAPAAAPSPASAPAKPAAPAAPAQPAAQAPAAGAAASPAAKPAAVADWQAEWDKLVAAAKQEGTVVVAGPPGDLFRQAALE